MNTLQIIGSTLKDTLLQVLNQVISYAPVVLIAVVLVVIGFVLGNILGRAVAHFITLLKVDRALGTAGLNNLSEQTGVKVSVAKTLGALVRWAIIIAFVLSASQVMGLYAFSSFLLFILGYIPTILVAALILVVTFLLADFVSRLVSGSARAVNMPSSVAAFVAKYSIIVAGVISALAQLNIAAAGLLEILFGGIVAAVALAVGLAFGLGGRDAAARAIEKMESNWK